MVNYLGKFIPNLTDKTKILRDLEKKNIDFIWTENHQKHFENIKNVISKNTLLRYFNIKDEITIQCDASQHGLGAVLM